LAHFPNAWQYVFERSKSRGRRHPAGAHQIYIAVFARVFVAAEKS
jgi:hypothetical protein